MICLSIILITLGLSILVKIYLKLTSRWCTSKVCLVGKTMIVTGANTGTGYHTALEFAKRGARVILACKNDNRANKARDRIIRETQNKNVVVRIIDMSSLKSVRSFANNILETEERLDVLVNNAGIIGSRKKVSEDGLDLLMQINYFGPFLLTVLLTGLLKKSAPSRIVNVSSIAAAYAKMDIDKFAEYPGRLYLYSNSKLCKTLFTIHLAKLLEETNVTVYSLHPGAVDTDLFRNVVGFKKILFDYGRKIYFKTPEEGAQTTINTSIAQNIEVYSGRHFEECRVVKTYKTAADADLQKKLWHKTVELLKLEEEIKNL